MTNLYRSLVCLLKRKLKVNILSLRYVCLRLNNQCYVKDHKVLTFVYKYLLKEKSYSVYVKVNRHVYRSFLFNQYIHFWDIACLSWTRIVIRSLTKERCSYKGNSMKVLLSRISHKTEIKFFLSFFHLGKCKYIYF